MKNLFNTLSLLAVVFCFFACGTEQATEVASDAKKEIKVVKENTAKAVKTATATGGLEVGDTAPDFKLKNVDDAMVSLADMKDAKGYIITFTCNHCPYSVMYEDRLIELHNKTAAMGYPVIAINPNDPAVQEGDSFDDMKVRSKEKAFPFVYLFDDGQKVYPQYGATRTPHVFLLDKDRKVTYIGAIDDNARDAKAVEVKYVENAITAMEKGEMPDPSFTKAIGCSIKKKRT